MADEDKQDEVTKIEVKGAKPSSSDSSQSEDAEANKVDEDLLDTINLHDGPDQRGPNQKADSDDTQYPNAPLSNQPEKPKKSGKGKKILVIFVILLLLGGGAAAAWYFYFKDKYNAEPAQEQTAQESQKEPADTYKMQTVSEIIYAHGGQIDAPGLIYTRPATGGERKEIASVEELGGVVPQYSAGASYVYLNGKPSEPSQIWLAKGVQVPEKIYEMTGSENIILSAVLSNDEKTVYFSQIPNPYATGTNGGGTSKLFKLKVEGENNSPEEVGSVETGALFIYAISKDESKLLAAKGCYACDGSPDAPEIFTIADKKLGKTFEMEAFSFGAFSINRDFSKIIYVENTIDKNKAEDGLLGYYAGPPHKIHLLDLNSKENKVIATVGEELSSSLDSTFTPQVGWGQTDDSYQPYYTTEKTVVLRDLDADNDSTLFESTTTAIQKVFWVSSKEVIVSIQAAEDGSVINYYNVEKKEAANIMETTDLTKILGLIVE